MVASVTAMFAVAAMTCAPALAGMRGAPRASGTLNLGRAPCDRDSGFDLVTTECSFGAYSDRNLDLGARTFYLADWTQLLLNPKPGWCVVSAVGYSAPEGASIQEGTPSADEEPGFASVGLADAAGSDLGSLAKTFRPSDGDTSAGIGSSAKGDRFEWRWRGPTNRAVRIVVGYGFTVEGDPNDLLVTSSASTVTTKRCGGPTSTKEKRVIPMRSFDVLGRADF